MGTKRITKQGKANSFMQKNKDDKEPKQKGRPKSITKLEETKNTTAAADANAKKRGRPKKKYTSRYNDDQPVVPTRVTKVDGYCPNCHTALCSFDKYIVEQRKRLLNFMIVINVIRKLTK